MKEAIIEGLLFIIGDEGLTYEQIENVLEIKQEEAIKLVNNLKEKYKSPESGLDIKILGDHLKLTTKSEHKEYLQKLIDIDDSDTLSESALETLAIIAYNQPVTRVMVDEIRGINSSHMVRKLAYKNLIAEVGRAETPGRPILYATTPLFLDYFGLKNISDLPIIEQTQTEEESELYTSKYTES